MTKKKKVQNKKQYKKPTKSIYFKKVVNRALRDPMLKEKSKIYKKYAIYEYGERMSIRKIMEMMVVESVKHEDRGMLKEALSNKKTWKKVKNNIRNEFYDEGNIYDIDWEKL